MYMQQLFTSAGNLSGRTEIVPIDNLKVFLKDFFKVKVDNKSKDNYTTCRVKCIYSQAFIFKCGSRGGDRGSGPPWKITSYMGFYRE